MKFLLVILIILSCSSNNKHSRNVSSVNEIFYETPNHEILIRKDGIEIDEEYREWRLTNESTNVGIAAESYTSDIAESDSCLILTEDYAAHMFGPLASQKNRYKYIFSHNRLFIKTTEKCMFFLIPSKGEEVKSIDPKEQEERFIKILKNLTNN